MDWSLSRVGKYYGATHLELAGESRGLIKRDENKEMKNIIKNRAKKTERDKTSQKIHIGEYQNK